MRSHPHTAFRFSKFLIVRIDFFRGFRLLPFHRFLDEIENNYIKSYVLISILPFILGSDNDL